MYLLILMFLLISSNVLASPGIGCCCSSQAWPHILRKTSLWVCKCWIAGGVSRVHTTGRTTTRL